MIALLSTILGLIGGALPDVLKMAGKAQDASHERALLLLQAELQLKSAQATADAKFREIEAGVYAAEAQAMREYVGKLWESQSKPTGIKWLDAFNGSLRPTFVSLCMIMFAVLAVPFVDSLLADHAAAKLDAIQMATILRDSIFGEGILGSIFYLLGYRTSTKLSARIT